MKPIRDKHEWPLIAVCDIEADEWVNIMCVCHMDEYGNRKAFPTREKYMDWLFSKKFQGEIVWAHWGGHYDFQFLVAEAFKRNWTCQVKLSGGLMLLTKVTDGNKRSIILADSSRLLPDSLAKIAKSIGKEKYDVDRAKLKQMSWDELQDYCMNDCRILYAALQNMRQTLTSVGCDFAYTLASICTRYVRRSGVIDWKRLYDVKDGKLVYSELMTAADLYCMAAHIGGRTEAIITGKHKRLYLYDITSSYPSAMMQPLPLYPKGYFPPSRDLENDLHKCGVSDATIFIPSGTMHVPLLPLRYKGKLVFPEGHFRGRWTNVELLAFYERVKRDRRVKIQIHSQYTFEPKPFLKPFTEMFWQLRQDAILNDDDFKSYAFKIALNSVYGKLKEAIKKHEVCFGDIIGELIDKHHIGTEEQTPGVTLEKSGTPGIYLFGSEAEGPFTHVAAGAYITALGRVKLYEGMERCLREGAQVFYVDTDSIITDKPIWGLKRNKQLGEWSLEAIIENAEIFCPKVYKYEKDRDTLKHNESPFIYKTKGMPMRLDKLSDAETEERWQAFTQRFQSGGARRAKPEKEGIYGFRRNIARGRIEPEAYKLPRMMQQPDTKRIHTATSSDPLYVELTDEEWRLAKEGKLR